MNLRQRVAVGALTLSALGFAGIFGYEDYSDRAIVPVPGDPPTIGYGSTRHADGTPWRCHVVANPLGYARKGEQASFIAEGTVELDTAPLT